MASLSAAEDTRLLHREQQGGSEFLSYPNKQYTVLRGKQTNLLALKIKMEITLHEKAEEKGRNLGPVPGSAVLIPLHHNVGII